MKPYAFRGDGTDDTGCCPNHDAPTTRRWSGTYGSRNSKKAKSKDYREDKRSRRRVDRHRFTKELQSDD